MPPPPRLPRRRNIRSVQADLRKNISGSPDRAATPRAPSEKSDRLSLELKEEFERVFSQKLKVTQGDRQRLISRWVAGLEQLSIQFAKGDRHARRDVFYFAEKLGVDLLTSTKSSDDTLSADHQAMLDAYVERRMQEKATSASAPVLAPPELLDDSPDEADKNEKKGEDHDDHETVDVSPQLVLQALLEKDLMAFTEFAFSVVRPGGSIEAELASGRGHIQAIPSSKGLHPTLDHHAAPALAQVSMRIGGSARMVSRPLSLGARGRGLLF